MNEYVMRHPKLPNQPIVVLAWDESDLSEQLRAGWKVAKTDPDKVRDETQPAPEPPAAPVNPKK